MGQGATRPEAAGREATLRGVGEIFVGAIRRWGRVFRGVAGVSRAVDMSGAFGSAAAAALMAAVTEDKVVVPPIDL